MAEEKDVLACFGQVEFETSTGRQMEMSGRQMVWARDAHWGAEGAARFRGARTEPCGPPVLRGGGGGGEKRRATEEGCPER